MGEPRILVVDASPMGRRIFARVLRQHLPECRLTVCTTAEAGLESALSSPPDCAILDLNLPETNGIELCRELKERPETAGFPVLLIAAEDADTATRVEGIEAGADDFLRWPCPELDLVSRIRVMLRVHAAESELRAVNRALASVAEIRSRDLRESDSRYTLLFERGSDAILSLSANPDGRDITIIDGNPVACGMLGYEREKLVSAPLAKLVNLVEAQSLTRRLRSVTWHGELFFETVLRHQGGGEVPVAFHARAFRVETGWNIAALLKPVDEGRVVYGRRASDERYRVLARQTGMLIYDMDLATGVREVSGATASVMGREPEELHSLTLDEYGRMIHPDDLPTVEKATKRAIDTLGTYQYEYRLRHGDGEYRNVEDSGVVLPDEAGQARRLLGSIRDVTARVQAEAERRRLERDVQHSQKLESLGVLAGGIAHDFNNILAAIIGLTDMTLQDLEPETDSYVDLKEVLGAAHRAKELVQQILAFSRQTGEERSPLLLHVVVRECLYLLRATLPATVEIIDNVDVHSGAAEANATQIHQVVMNLCTNAAQAMKNGGGTLELRVENVEVDASMARSHAELHPGSFVRISVHDTGHGMEPAVLERIFDPFFSTKGPGEGTGMGLAVAHGIVRNHGGAIVVETRPGMGSTFHVYLPRVEADTVENAPEAEPYFGGSERVLFVDDEEAVLRFAQSALPRLGYEVVLCGSAFEALDRLKEAPDSFDLVITDQMMPKRTGIDLARDIQAVREDLPIILFTGFSYQVTDEQAEQAGIREVVLKPIITTDLAEAMRRVLDGEAPAHGPVQLPPA